MLNNRNVAHLSVALFFELNDIVRLKRKAFLKRISRVESLSDHFCENPLTSIALPRDNLALYRSSIESKYISQSVWKTRAKFSLQTRKKDCHSAWQDGQSFISLYLYPYLPWNLVFSVTRLTSSLTMSAIIETKPSLPVPPGIEQRKERGKKNKSLRNVVEW